jgi:crotonobetainyl-CoA:carnitine CoA-transferase CaiB-like acyl-CoA transferase
MATRDLDEVDRLFHEAGAVGTPVWSAADLIEHPHVLARDMVLSVQDAALGMIRMPGIVPKLTRTPGSVRHSGLAAGSCNQSVFEELLGLDEAALTDLVAEGVI